MNMINRLKNFNLTSVGLRQRGGGGAGTMRPLKKLAAICAVVAAPFSVNAAAIDLAAQGYESTGTVFTFNASNVQVFGGALTVFDLGNSGSGFAASDPNDALTYTMNLVGSVFGTDALTAAAGSALDLPASPGPLQILFASASGAGAFLAADGAPVLLDFPDNSLSFADGSFAIGQFSYTVTILRDIAPIPLPAGGVLLLAGAGSFVLLRKRKAA